MLKIIVFALTLILTLPAFAHGGGLNASGCHNDRKRGGYHCHGTRQNTGLTLLSKAKRKAAFSKVKRKAKRGLAQAQSLLSTNDVYFANCSEARVAGAAPVREGDAGYALRLDRDRDGIGCE